MFFTKLVASQGVWKRRGARQRDTGACVSLAESLSFRRCAALGSLLDSSRLLLPEKMNSDQGGNGQCLGSESAHPWLR